MKKLEINPTGDFQLWDQNKINELECMSFPTTFGNRKLIDNKLATLWEIILEPKERLDFRKHEYPFMFHCVNGGFVITRYGSGKIDLIALDEGDNHYQELREGFIIQDLENVGDELIHLKLLQFKNNGITEIPTLPAILHKVG